jgi:uncharacterized repeat protein (TIGR03833 family)
MNYISGGRFMRIKKKKDQKGNTYGDVSRISCEEYNKSSDVGKIKPRVGNKVIIIIKPYNQYNCKTGIVERVLTNSQIHTHGHKVKLKSGDVGRTMKILSK